MSHYRLRLLTAAVLASSMASPAMAATFTVDSPDDHPDASPGDRKCADASGACTLRAALQEANATSRADNIVLTTNVYQLTIAGAGEDMAATGDLDVLSPLSIDGNNSVIDANGIDRAFDVLAPGRLEISDVRVMNGAPPAAESGGAFRSDSDLSITGSKINNNTVTGAGASGGAVFNNGGNLNMFNSTMSGNSAVRAGGAIEANAGVTVLRRTSMYENAAGPEPGNGGGLHLTGAGEVTMSSGVVRNNTATAEGGGLWNSAVGKLTVSDVVLSFNVANGNEADQGGGALFNDGGTMFVFDSSIDNNTADGAAGSGGGILNNLGTLRVKDSKLYANTSARAGGGIESNEGVTNLQRVDLIGNTTGGNPGNGGGLHITGAGAANVTAGIVKDNLAAAEGGGLWNGGGRMVVTRTIISGNIASGEAADQGGGGLFNNGGTLIVNNATIEWNMAEAGSGSGGGILNDQGILIVRDSDIAGNSSLRAGGGIEANIGDTTLQNVLLYSNSTRANPGNGGGLHLTGAGNVTIRSSGIFFNDAASEGGGLWNSTTGTTRVSNTGIENNTAPIGPGVFNDGGVFTIDGEAVAPQP